MECLLCAGITQHVISFTATTESLLAVIHSLQMRNYMLREAQTWAKVLQLVRNGAGVPAQVLNLVETEHLGDQNPAQLARPRKTGPTLFADAGDRMTNPRRPMNQN